MLLGVAGHGLVGAATGRLPWPARGGVAVGAGFLAAGVPLLALADAGWFGGLGVGLVGVLLVVAACCGGGRARRVGALPVVLLSLAGAGAATLPAYPFDVGGRDAGFYVMTSHHLQDEGGLRMTVDPDVREGMQRAAPGALGLDDDLPLPGFFVREADARGTAAIVPHGYHLTPAAMAGGGTVTGGGGQWVVTLLGGVLVLLAAGAAALLVRRGLRGVASVAAGMLLAGNAALIYFSRYPMTEVPSGVVLLTGGLATAAALRGAGLRAAVLAGATLGAAPLVRPDAWPLLVVAPLAALLLLHRDRAAARAFAGGLLPLTALAALRALTASREYTDTTIGYVLGGVSPAAVVLALAIGSAGTALLVATVLPAAFARRTLDRVLRACDGARPRRVAATVVLLTALVVAVRPPSLGLEILRTYATPPGILLAGAGAAGLLVTPAADRRRLLPLLPLFGLALVALALVARSPQVLVPDQYWTARRYLPVALPVGAALSGLAVALAWGVRGLGRSGRMVAVAAPFLAVAAFALSLWDARQAIFVTEFDGVPARVAEIDDLLEGDDPLVVVGPGSTAWGVVGPALLLRQDRDVVMLRSARDGADDRTATLDDPRLSRWLGGVVRRRPVYLVTANVPPFRIASNPADVGLETVGQVGLPITQIEQRVGGPPRRHDTTTDLVAVYRLAPGTGR